MEVNGEMKMGCRQQGGELEALVQVDGLEQAGVREQSVWKVGSCKGRLRRSVRKLGTVYSAWLVG